MSSGTEDADRRTRPDLDAPLADDAGAATWPTRPRVTRPDPLPESDPEPFDSEGSPMTLPVATMRVLRPKPMADGATAEPPRDDPPPIGRLLSAVPSLAGAGPREQTIAVHRKIATTPTAPPALIPRPRLRVLRGLKIDAEYPLCEGSNLIGRHDDKPVDIDLIDQEPADRVWASRQHAIITYENGILTVEDLHSLNGTFVNRHQLFPGRKRTLAANDILQIGTIQLKLVF